MCVSVNSKYFYQRAVSWLKWCLKERVLVSQKLLILKFFEVGLGGAPIKASTWETKAGGSV